MKSWNWFLERSKDYQTEPEHPLTNKEDLFEYINSIKQHFKNKKVLDIGCGRTNELRDYLNQLGISEYLGMDMTYYEGKMTADMHDIPLPSEYVDIVIYNNVLEHSISPYLTLIESNRILKKDGYVIIGLPIGDGHDKGDSHFINLNKTQLINLLNKAKFQLINNIKVNTMQYYLAQKS